MKITYHGHSSIHIQIGDKALVIDPFLRGNPQAVAKPEDIQADYVLLTHAHMDHILDAEPIAKQNNAPIVAAVELAGHFEKKGLQTVQINTGGTVDLGFAQVKMVQAFHSSGITLEDGSVIYGGQPGGYLVKAEGLTILHTGDTALYGDMKMIGDRNDIDVVFLPIGDKFTMGPEDALQAAEWYQAKLVVPVHYDTFDVIRQDAESFVNKLKERGMRGQVLAIGEQLSLS
ncbi:metal-dependent hydrolase [Paenibacillus protaetiae]|uniref:UPF0173 metal-dependent hydrolase ET464_10915 n=1 Tax=Paenibacillus protaetiae TaxID=2509456 RepID=A0A4P6F1B5_9BACL|nr:metal-dependent hydrolase [Paenibacillus protaetiae]QAY66827.1 metal-dependent hydrolase [Paenibacillus protaetiae]